MSQDLNVNIVCVQWGGDGFSLLCVSLNKAECVFIWQCSSVHVNHPGRNLLAHLVSLIPLPSGSGYAEGPQLSPQRTVENIIIQ